MGEAMEEPTTAVKSADQLRRKFTVYQLLLHPTGLTMSIYVPAQLATNPAVILAVSSSPTTGHFMTQKKSYIQTAEPDNNTTK
jgi:hypothetical protein